MAADIDSACAQRHTRASPFRYHSSTSNSTQDPQLILLKVIVKWWWSCDPRSLVDPAQSDISEVVVVIRVVVYREERIYALGYPFMCLICGGNHCWMHVCVYLTLGRGNPAQKDYVCAQCHTTTPEPLLCLFVVNKQSHT